MTDPSDKTETKLALIRLLPNVLTMLAICAGLSAIRFGILGNYTLAVQLILAAGVLDGLDGRVARLLGVESPMGAELDSFADFLNFGVAPPLIIYFWALQDIRSLAWIAVLAFALCSVMRLARFNVTSKSEDSDPMGAYFVGVPTPAGALLVMLPMYLSFAFANAPLVPGAVICVYMIGVGYLMISRIPTWSFKASKISRGNVKFFLIGVSCLGAALLTFEWVTLIALCLAYAGTVVWGIIDRRNQKAN